MNVEVELPDLGTGGGDQATVVEWRFEEGECVEEGEILMEVSCAGGTVEVPSPCSGTLVELIVDEDETVRVGEPIALIDAAEEEKKESDDEAALPKEPDEDDEDVE